MRNKLFAVVIGALVVSAGIAAPAKAAGKITTIIDHIVLNTETQLMDKVGPFLSHDLINGKQLGGAYSMLTEYRDGVLALNYAALRRFEVGGAVGHNLLLTTEFEKLTNWLMPLPRSWHLDKFQIGAFFGRDFTAECWRGGVNGTFKFDLPSF